MGKENLGRVVGESADNFFEIVTGRNISVDITTTPISVPVSLKANPKAIIPVIQGGAPFIVSVNSWSATSINIGLRGFEKLSNRVIQFIALY